MRILFFACSLGAILACISTTHANPASPSNDLIDQICKTALNQSFCLNFLHSLPGSATASAKELGQVSIEKAESKANATVALIRYLLKKANDPKLKGQFESCLENFIDAIDNLNEAKAALGSGGPGDVNNYASAASTDVDTCADDFSGDAPQFKEETQNLHNIISVVLAISNHLNV